MGQLKLVCETKKIIDRFKSVMTGNGLLVGREIDDIKYKDQKGNEMRFYDTGVPIANYKCEKDSFDYVIAIMFICEETLVDLLQYDKLLDLVKPNGFLVLYIPHAHYYPFPGGVIPHDVLVELKHIDQYMFEILDFQTYGFEGTYNSQDLEKVEYGFHILIKKANNLLAVKDLSDDPGQLVSLED